MVAENGQYRIILGGEGGEGEGGGGERGTRRGGRVREKEGE